MNRNFLVVFEIGETSFGAMAPDIPGCFAVGPTLDETRRRFLEAVNAHLEWMASDHDAMPEPSTSVFDFAPDPGQEPPKYYVEWLPISIPYEARHAISA